MLGLLEEVSMFEKICLKYTEHWVQGETLLTTLHCGEFPCHTRAENVIVFPSYNKSLTFRPISVNFLYVMWGTVFSFVYQSIQRAT